MIQRRNLLLQCLWFVLTLGFYMVYWYYVSCKEMADYLESQDREQADSHAKIQAEPLLWLILFLIPLAQVYSMYKQGELYEVFAERTVDRWVILLLWLFFPPAVWFIIQRKLNETASRVPV